MVAVFLESNINKNKSSIGEIHHSVVLCMNINFEVVCQGMLLSYAGISNSEYFPEFVAKMWATLVGVYASTYD